MIAQKIFIYVFSFISKCTIHFEFLNVQCTVAGSILCVSIFDCIWHFQSQAIDIRFTVGKLNTLLCKISVTFFQSCQIQACGFRLITYSYICFKIWPGTFQKLVYLASGWTGNINVIFTQEKEREKMFPNNDLENPLFWFLVDQSKDPTCTFRIYNKLWNHR